MTTLEIDYRRILKSKLEERCNANSNYSLRAFARDLGLSPSRLCLILKNKQGLSIDYAKKIAVKLGLNNEETSHFVCLVVASDGRKKVARLQALKDLSEKRELSHEQKLLQVEVFRIISDWYHFAILELTKVKGFQSSPTWVAKRLGISQYQAEGGIERLLSVGLLEIKKGKLIATNTKITTQHPEHAEANRKFHQQVVEKALKALTLQPISQRDYSALTIAINKKDLPEFKKRITEFRRDLNEFAEESILAKAPDEVYGLTVQLFKLSESES